MRLVVASTLALLACGCLAGTGRQVQTAQTQHQKVGWTNEEFTQEATGTHDNNMLMAEGPHIVLKYDDDGKLTIDANQSVVTALLITSPSSRNASNSLSVTVQAQADMFSKALEGITATFAALVPFIVRQPPPSTSPPGTSRADMIRDIIAAIREHDARAGDDGG